METAQDRQTAFDDMEIPCIVRIFSLLAPKDCARAACVHSLWNSAAGDDSIWKGHLLRKFLSGDKNNVDGTTATSYRSAYANWESSYADVSPPLLQRSLAMWTKIKSWLAVNSPQILDTLNPGATAEQVAAAEAELGHRLPDAVRCIYRVCNGQDLKLSAPGGNPNQPPPNLLMGLFGTLMFYDHISSNALLSLDAAVKISKVLRSIRPMGAGSPLISSKQVVFAHSFKKTDKICLFDADTGAITMKALDQEWPMAPTAGNNTEAPDALLRWMEEYARRLSSGWYSGCESDSMAKEYTASGVQVAGAISLFPRVYPAAATAITRGVQVMWSSVFVPQQSHSNSPGRLMFTYNVRYRLLTPEQETAALAQLQAEQERWRQQQQQLGDAGPAAGQQQQQQQQQQRIAIGPCDASAGTACVPATLAAPASWAPAAARSSSSGSSIAPAPAGPLDPAATAGSSSSRPITISCQLDTRNWSILDTQGDQADSVSGEGVVGLYPLLFPGCEEFSYASCTPFSALGTRDAAAAAAAAGAAAAAEGGPITPQQLVGRVLGGMEGGFEFVEGNMMQRAGPGFHVKCPRLVFAVPEYLY